MEKLLVPVEKIKLLFHSNHRAKKRSIDKWLFSGWVLIILVLSVMFIAYELRTSRFEAYFLSRVAKDMNFRMEPGTSPSIRFPKTGPYDERLGYTYLPAFVDRLTAKGFSIDAQARISPRLREFTDKGYFTAYHEKTQAGLLILGRDDKALFSASYPERVYSDFSSIPEVITRTLLFIENKELLNERLPYLNPAVEWDRLAKAVILKGRHLIDRDERSPGGSTLATQMEKYRHSAEGMTSSVYEKYRQMKSAALRAYLNGEKTLDSRNQIVLDYINSIPLGAAPGYGQVNGLGDGLYAWYGADFDNINRSLTGGKNKNSGPEITEWASAYKQAISLFLAQRRPSFYLLENQEALESKTDGYLRVLAENGTISSAERDAALQVKLNVQKHMPVKRKAPYVERKAANAVRPRLLSLLAVPQLYDLDLLDLTVKSTLDHDVQEDVTGVLQQLGGPDFARSAGLYGSHLLKDGNSPNVIYSFTLYERAPGANLLRIQADNFDQPLNINEGVKLELGSSAKLRTLVSYLNIIAELHGRYAGFSAEQLKAVPVEGTDQLSRWAIEYLLNSTDKNLSVMLEAAMERNYSASPAERFFTGGGVHTFANYDNKFDHRVISVREAFHNSVNLVFIRMMRDIVRYYTFQRPGIKELMADMKDPRRREYLSRFADKEGRTFLYGFYRKYHGKSFDDALEILLQNIKPTPVRLATIFRSVKPEAGFEEFSSFIRSRLPNSTLSDNSLRKFYDEYSQEAFPLVDRGYIAHVHPLELWTVAYLRDHPEAGITEIVKASENERQEVYNWLFNTHSKNKQDIRIRTLLEVESFSEIHKEWKRLKYPFDSLVPSYATAIGSSADRPSALAELTGIVLNNGEWNPSVRIQELHFAKDTPYETILKPDVTAGEKVMLPEVASVVKDALIGVVQKGTAQRLKKAFLLSDGTPVVVGGKTGTGDNRRDVYGQGGRLIQSQAINRTAVFVFFLGDRFFGTITAYVAGAEADEYKFTSLLPVQVMNALAPKIIPLIERVDKDASQRGS
ncbi:MAG: transglycosylase domain-containing protein [Nitrospirae bacterium]|nr:transglycosylase domain-containing protein [Nitrospirota bacterium]